MHAILGGHTEWRGFPGFATEATTYIEVPSQMLDGVFPADDKLLQRFARHYDNG